MKARVVALVGLAAFAGILTWALWPADESPFHEMVARLRAAGEPVDVEGLREPDVPPEENGAADVVAAAAWLKANVTQEQWDAAPGPWRMDLDEDWRDHVTPEQREAAARFAEQLEPFFEHVHAAVRKRRIQFRGPLDAFGFATDSHTPQLQRVNSTMFAGMFGAADPSRRCEEIRTEIELSRRLECVGVLDHMVAQAVLRSALDVLRRDLGAGRLDATQCRTALDPLLTDRWISRFPQMARAERVSVISIYRGVLAGTPLPTMTFPSPFAKPAPWYRRIWDSLTERPWIRPGMAKEIVAHCTGLGKLAVLTTSDYDALHTHVADLAAASPPESPAKVEMPRILDRLAKTEASSAIARIALAAADHRARHGALPASLAELAWAFPGGLPVDPLTGGALVVTSTANGLRITSAKFPGRAENADAVEDDALLRENGLLWELPK